MKKRHGQERPRTGELGKSIEDALATYSHQISDGKGLSRFLVYRNRVLLEKGFDSADEMIDIALLVEPV